MGGKKNFINISDQETNQLLSNSKPNIRQSQLNLENVLLNSFTKFDFAASGLQTGGINTESSHVAIFYTAFLFGFARDKA
jgi:hypothetical protein